LIIEAKLNSNTGLLNDILYKTTQLYLTMVTAPRRFLCKCTHLV